MAILRDVLEVLFEVSFSSYVDALRIGSARRNEVLRDTP